MMVARSSTVHRTGGDNEYHHDRKKDAPSGTALRTAQQLKRFWDTRCRFTVSLGLATKSDLGLHGQTLTIRHDSTSRESFAGVKLAIENINNIDGVVIGLEYFLFSPTPLEPSHI